jgi:Ca2+-binding EF-hand superfamily protein
MNTNNERQKRYKITYNPITNEYIQRNPNNINSNPNNNRKTPLNQINNSNNESTASTITNNTNANINREEQAKDITINSLNKLKSTLIMRGIHSIFSFQRKLSLYDLNHQGLISFENFSNITQAYTMGISNDELKIIFDLFDKEKTGLINYNDLIQTIIGQISPQRKIIIKNVFDKFNKDNNGKVSINEIKLLFNPRRHPDTISGKKREGEVFGEFLDDIENYKEYLENSRGVYDNTFSLEDFINFYNEIGVCIDDDTIFEYMMNNCWNLDNNNNNMGGSRYKNNTAHDFRNNNTNSGNLMARAGSQIINNNIF